jgi:archaellum biogenesis ATPase FlaH
MLSKNSTRSRKEFYLKKKVSNAKQSAIVEAIQSEKNNIHEIVIITDSLSMIMAAENRASKKNPNTQTIRKMRDHGGPRIMGPQSRGNTSK